MERRTQEALADWVSAFDAKVAQGRQIREQLTRAGWTIDHLRPSPDRRSWLLYLQPTPKLRRRFDLAPEVLAVLAPFEKAQASEIDVAERALRETHRLDRGLVLFLSGDLSAERELAAVLPAERAYVFLQIDEFLSRADPEAANRRLLAEHLGSGRPFTPGSPVSDWQFFGRQAELLELERRLLETSQPVGLFGLRKMGKTSLIHRLRHKWRQDRGSEGPRALLVYCDLQSIPFSRRSRAGLMRKLVEELRATLAELELGEVFAASPWVTHDLRRADDPTLIHLAVEALDEVLEWAARSSSTKLVVAIDEYERLLNEEAFPRRDGLELLDLLRGYTQQRSRSFSFVVAGLHRRWALQARYEGRQNPLFGALYQMPLGGLSHQELNTLVRKLGRRAGLDFDHEAAARIFKESGGHPYIARLFADLIDQRTPGGRVEPIQVHDPLVVEALPALDREAATTMREIADTLEDLARSGDKAAPAAAATWLRHIDAAVPPAIADDLVRYGLADASTRIAVIGAFVRWARENYGPTLEVAHG